MKEQLISFETAKLAKEKGFNIPVLYGVYGKQMKLTSERPSNLVNWNAEPKQQKYSQATSIPTQSLLQKWLRNTHKIHIEPQFSDMTWGIYIGTFSIPDFAPDEQFYLEESEGFKDAINSYEKVLEKGLYEALKLI